MLFGQTIILVINFLTYPAWHLVAFFAVLFLMVIFWLLSTLGF